jgi:outer membrane biosynthesis protein TonB
MVHFMTRTSTQFGTALAVAAALHGAVFAVAVLLVWKGWIASSATISWDAGLPEEDAVVVVVAPEVVAPAETKPAPNQSLRFVRTDESQQSDSPPEQGTTQFFSDRNTKAASEADPNPVAAANLPSQKGKDSPVLDFADRAFGAGEYSEASRQQTGLTPNQTMPGNQAQPSPPPPDLTQIVREAEAKFQEKLTAAAQANQTTTPVVDPSSDLSTTELKDLPKDPLLKEPKWEKLLPVEPKPKVDAADQPKPTAPKTPAVTGGSPGMPRGRDPNAAQAQTMKNAVQGGISNRGKASVEAADSPMGRYMAKVNAAVSQKFTPACMRAADRITFGSVQVEFDVNLKGGVENLRIVKDGTSNAILQDLVLGVVLEAKLPPIPSELVDHLIGNRLHITYGFLFH